MNNYLSNITPDSFSGIVFAFEGIDNSVTLINGPTGCKFYHSATSDNQTIKQFEFDPLNYPEKWYFGQPRVPCTYLDSGDYIYGSRDKLIETLEFIRDNVKFELLCIVNSPGAALIGDDLHGIANNIVANKQIVIVETPGFSSDISIGFETASVELLKQIPLNKSISKKNTSVNILGLSIYHKYYNGDIAELKRLFSLCEIEVNCVLFADCDLEKIKDIGKADLNIVVHPEYGLATAKYLNEELDIPYYSCDGPPIGFASTEKMMIDICKLLNKDSATFIVESEKARGKAYSYISRVNSLTGLPKGVEIAIEGTYSELYSYCNFLVKYFGMIVDCASVLNQNSTYYKDNLKELLEEFSLDTALFRNIMETNAEMVFGSGNTIAGLKLRKKDFVGIETCLPTLGYIDIIPKTHLGIQGALTITEQILNGLIF